jgi:hypothetical protein
LACQVRALSGQTESKYSSRHAAYDLKKFRAKDFVRKIESTRRYEVVPQGLRAMSALLVLRDKVIKPLLAAACQLKRGPNPLPPALAPELYDTQWFSRCSILLHLECSEVRAPKSHPGGLVHSRNQAHNRGISVRAFIYLNA